MDYNITVALITGVLAVFGSLVGNIAITTKKSHADELKNKERETEQNLRLKSIEKKLDLHNGYAEKFGDIQKDIAVIKKDIEYMKEKNG